MKLVLIPGLDGTADLFAPFVEAMKLVGRYQDVETLTIAYPPDRAMSYAEHVAWVREKLPAGDHVLLAESFSGPVGITIAAESLANLKGLILCCTFASNPLPVFGPLRRILGALPAVKIPPGLFAPFLYAGHATPELRRAHAQAMAKVSADCLRARAAEILAVDVSSQLRRVAVPLLYLLAKRDRMVPHSAFRRIQRIKPGVELAEFEAPHFLLQTEPYRCARAVLDFLELVTTGRRPEVGPPDSPLTDQEARRVAQLTEEELKAIDDALLGHCVDRWRKVARVVASAMDDLSGRIPGVPDVFYSSRVGLLVERGKLKSSGNLDYMRCSEVRLP